MYITYQLVIRIEQDITITVGKFGTYTFTAGNYTYTGSAKKNFEARVSRHLSKEKRLKWHIDYLLAHPDVKIINVIRSTVPECVLNKQTVGTPVVYGFGSSDCKDHCGSHLLKQ